MSEEFPPIVRFFHNDYITLRDQFAMAAMQGILANNWSKMDMIPNYETARFAYEMADAMIKERDNAV